VEPIRGAAIFAAYWLFGVTIMALAFTVSVLMFGMPLASMDWFAAAVGFIIGGFMLGGVVWMIVTTPKRVMTGRFPAITMTVALTLLLKFAAGTPSLSGVGVCAAVGGLFTGVIWAFWRLRQEQARTILGEREFG
jgi:membrane associated rhomboid family serine protease